MDAEGAGIGRGLRCPMTDRVPVKGAEVPLNSLRIVAAPVAGLAAYLAAVFLLALSWLCYDDTPGIVGAVMTNLVASAVSVQAAHRVGRLPGAWLYVGGMGLLNLLGAAITMAEHDVAGVLSAGAAVVGLLAGAFGANLSEEPPPVA